MNRWREWLGGEPSGGTEPDYRFTLANERTFLAYVRTALALLAGGVAVVQLAPGFGGTVGRHALSVLLLGLAVVVAAASLRRWRGNQRSMRRGEALPPTRLPQLLAAGVALAAVLAVVALAVG